MSVPTSPAAALVCGDACAADGFPVLSQNERKAVLPRKILSIGAQPPTRFNTRPVTLSESDLFSVNLLPAASTLGVQGHSYLPLVNENEKNEIAWMHARETESSLERIEAP